MNKHKPDPQVPIPATSQPLTDDEKVLQAVLGLRGLDVSPADSSKLLGLSLERVRYLRRYYADTPCEPAGDTCGVCGAIEDVAAIPNSQRRTVLCCASCVDVWLATRSWLIALEVHFEDRASEGAKVLAELQSSGLMRVPPAWRDLIAGMWREA